MKKVKSLSEAKSIFVKYTKEFTPNKTAHESYEEKYGKYKKSYQILKEIN